MQNDENSIHISGRLTKMPDHRETPSGISVCDLILASNQYLEGKQRTTFAKVTLWNSQADKMSSLLQKGDHIKVVGQLVDDNFIQRNSDGTPYRTHGRLKIEKAKIIILDAEEIDQDPAEIIPEI